MLRTSPEGVQLIEDSEVFVGHLYNDPVGHCTVGYGTLVHKGNCNGAPSEQPYINGIDKSRARALMMREVVYVEEQVREMVKVPIDQSEFDALVDFAYNLGCTALHDSTLLRLLNQGQYDLAAEEFGRWVFANHKKLSGLAVRRGKEKALFNRDLPRVNPSSGE